MGVWRCDFRARGGGGKFPRRCLLMSIRSRIHGASALFNPFTSISPFHLRKIPISSSANPPVNPLQFPLPFYSTCLPLSLQATRLGSMTSVGSCPNLTSTSTLIQPRTSSSHHFYEYLPDLIGIFKMPEPAQINRSLSTIRTELEFLQASNVLAPGQMASIIAQLPVCIPPIAFLSLKSNLLPIPNPPSNSNFPTQQNGTASPSPYTDPRYTPNPPSPQQFDPSRISQEAQNPNHPAHPSNPKHREWAKKMVERFGQAAVFGAGATFGGDLVNDVMRKF